LAHLNRTNQPVWWSVPSYATTQTSLFRSSRTQRFLASDLYGLYCTLCGDTLNQVNITLWSL